MPGKQFISYATWQIARHRVGLNYRRSAAAGQPATETSEWYNAEPRGHHEPVPVRVRDVPAISSQQVSARV